MRLLELLKKLPTYDELIKQVPEAERADAIAALEEQLKPYEALIAGVPDDALGKFMRSLDSNGTSTTSPSGAPGRREPRRF